MESEGTHVCLTECISKVFQVEGKVGLQGHMFAWLSACLPIKATVAPIKDKHSQTESMEADKRAKTMKTY